MRKNSKIKFNKDKKNKRIYSRKKKPYKKRQSKNTQNLEISVGEALVGTFYNTKKTKKKSKNSPVFGEVIPKYTSKCDKVYICKEYKNKIPNGMLVKCRTIGITGKKVYASVEEIIGKQGEPFVDIISLVKNYDWSDKFSDKVLEQAKRANKNVSEADILGRCDFRNETIVTIDGEDTRDFDDAISIRECEDRYVLGVHIADVSNYVQEGSAIDKEAYKRGTSLYLPGLTYHMLPEDLSKGICSLKEGEDRLTLSCIMEIDKNGNVLDSRICEGVINVYRRLTYNEVSEAIDRKKDDNIKKIDEQLKNMLLIMEKLAIILKNKREKKGSIEFDLKESSVVLDSYGEVSEIVIEKRTMAHEIVEEFMLIANECVARNYRKMNVPFLYRTHKPPKEDTIDDFIQYIKTTKYKFPQDADKIRASDFNNLLKEIKGEDDEYIISNMALRTMSKAIYSTEIIGHFALVKEDYCHFTSPIRRYPDLQIHRIIHDDIRKRLGSDKIEYYRERLGGVAISTSEMEQKANEIERKVKKMKIAEYMSSFLGEEFEGVISSVTDWGFYTELENTAEGLVHIKSLNGDHYEYIESEKKLVGKHNGKIYALGDKVKVLLENVNVDLGQIDFKVK